MRKVLFSMAAITVIALTAPAFGATIDVWMTTGPGRDGPNTDVFWNNSVDSALNGGSTVGTPGEPGSVNPVTEMTGRDFIRTPNELTYLGEYGNAWGNEFIALVNIQGDGSTQFKLHDTHWSADSTDSNDWFDGSGDFDGLQYFTGLNGIDWGADRAPGGGDDTIYTSGNGDTLVDQIVGSALRGRLDIDSNGDPLVDRYNDLLSQINAEVPFQIGVDFIQTTPGGGPLGVGGAGVNVTSTDLADATLVPEPASVVSGLALMGGMLLFGGRSLHQSNRQRTREL